MNTSFNLVGDLDMQWWLIVTVTTALSTIIMQAIYDAFFHPLSNVPGPFLARISKVPSWYYAARGDRHIWTWQLFETYGPKIRVTPNTVLFRGPDAYRDIYSQKANVHKAPFYESWKKDHTDVNTFNTRDPKLHALRRKRLNQSFTEKSLRASEPFIIQHIDRWNEVLVAEKDEKDPQWSKSVNFSEASDWLIFDIMGDLCFGTSFGIKEPDDNSFKAIPHAIVQYMQFFYPMTHSPFIDVFNWLKPRGLNKIFDLITPPNIRKYESFVKECVDKRVALFEAQKDKPENEQRQDMFWFLCNAKDDANRPAYTEGELRGEASLLIVAGTDTTSVTLTAFMFYITRNHMQYQKLIDEIRSKFSSPEEIVYGPTLRSCNYLKACIDEVMRLSPSGPGEFPRQVLKGGARINGDFYPEGTIVGYSGWASGHDERIFSNAEQFKPERWIPDEGSGITKEAVSALQACFHPFSAGPGSCAGKNIATLELLVTIARTLHRFDVRKALGGEGTLGESSHDRNIFQLQDAYIAVRNGPMVQFRERKI